MAALPILLLLVASFGPFPVTARSIPVSFAREKGLTWGNDDIPGLAEGGPAQVLGQEHGPSRQAVTARPSSDEPEAGQSQLHTNERRGPGWSRGGYGAPYSQRHTNVASGQSRRPVPGAPGPRPGYPGVAQRPGNAGPAPRPGYFPPPPRLGSGAPGSGRGQGPPPQRPGYTPPRARTGPGAPAPRPGSAPPPPRPGYAPPAPGRPEPAASAQRGSDTAVKGPDTAVKGPDTAVKGLENAAKGQAPAPAPAADAAPPNGPGSIVVNIPSDTSTFGKVERGANFAANSVVLANTLTRGGIDTAQAFKSREPAPPANAPQPETSVGATFDASSGWWHHKSVGYFKPEDPPPPSAKFHNAIGWYTTPDDIKSAPQGTRSTPKDSQATPQDSHTTPEDSHRTPEDSHSTPYHSQTTPQDSDEADKPVPQPEDQDNQPPAITLENSHGKNQTAVAS